MKPLVQSRLLQQPHQQRRQQLGLPARRPGAKLACLHCGAPALLPEMLCRTLLLLQWICAPHLFLLLQGLVFGVAVMGGTIKLFDSRNYQQGPFDAFGVSQGLMCPVGKPTSRSSLLCCSVNGVCRCLVTGFSFQGPDTLLLQVSSESKSLVTHLRFSPDGKQLVVVCGSRVHMLDAFTGKAPAVLVKLPHWPTSSLATLMASQSCLRLLNWDRSALAGVLHGHITEGSTAATHSGQPLLRMCCAAGVRKFTVTTGSEAMGLAMEPAFSPDGQYFGSGVLSTGLPSSAAI